jgi:catechol 2,3-dioxygenase-like lactoylglutathione lyase family enzyme
MKLGAFSYSLAVKDLQASKAFYEKLGFVVFHDQEQHNWLIMKNESVVLGLFQGMFEGNIMTFNPGWDNSAQEVEDWTDVREIQKQLKAAGVQFTTEVDESSEGPGSCMLTDPDGNQILLDQHR